ncbi:MAG: hypothetical protein ACKO4K_03760 [Flavobacteriales bacterium]
MKWMLLLLIPMVFGCAKSTSCTAAIQGKVKNYTGLDGCGWVIEANGKTFEPVNLNDFDQKFKSDNKKIWFHYEPFAAGSICMVGETIKITCIEEK